FWRPPLQGSAELNEHHSATAEAVALFVELIRKGRTVILFGRSRTGVERMLAEAREELGPDLGQQVSGYKAGYTPEERGRIEADLREGRLRGVVATNALELGIDIGTLDAAVLAGYPGTVMSTWQQAGRVGRRGGDEALIILVGADDALDQYYLNHPDVFFGLPSEQAVVDLENEPILLGHLLCAAKEASLRVDELGYFPPNAPRLLARLVQDGLLTAAPHRIADAGELPHRQVSIRGVSRDQHQVLDGRTHLATIEPPLLYREAHPGAVYLHNGVAYRVLEIDAAAKQVRVQREAGSGRTDPLRDLAVAPRGEPFQRRALPLGDARVEVSIGPLLATEEVSGYRETVAHNRPPLMRSLDPPYRFSLATIGLWLDFPADLAASAQALHTVEHALVNVLPVRLLCDRRDVGSSSDPSASPGGRIYLFDDHEGGIGLAEKAYLLIDQLAGAATDLLRDCRCAEGCPSCVHLAGCVSGNDGLDKAGALALLRGQAPAFASLASTLGDARDALTPTLSQRERGQLPLGEGGVRGAPGRTGDGQTRLRRIAEESLRERLAALPPIVAGEIVDWVGVGRVVVQEVKGKQARVQRLGSAAWSWVDLEELRPVGK
ncbi:MAG: DUF1998 domain-containing protein, partial [Chloroflexi bacterium]|nr:DUF1998 domain-containing protein [Chloroflexota bacterium]